MHREARSVFFFAYLHHLHGAFRARLGGYDMLGHLLRGVRVLFKLLLALVGLVVVLLSAILLWQAYSKPARPPGSPPIWLEGREKYSWDGVYNSVRFDNIPVDLWFGKRDGNFDTTHLRIASDYLGNTPDFHGSYVELNVVWPSLRSIDEEIEIRKKHGQPHMGFQTFYMRLGESAEGSYSFTDRKGTAPSTRCEPMIRDEARGVMYCNENHLNHEPDKRWTNYWPLDESIRTPYYNNPPRFHCYVVERPDETRFTGCGSHFSYNGDVRIMLDIFDEDLTIAILTDFPKLIDFLHTLEVTP